RGVDQADPLGAPHAQAQRRMHRHGDSDEPGLTHPLFVERLYGEVAGRRGGAGPLEKRPWPRQTERLVTQLVARQQEDGARLAQRVHGGGVFSAHRSRKPPLRRPTPTPPSQRTSMAIPTRPTPNPTPPSHALSRKNRVI